MSSTSTVGLRATFEVALVREYHVGAGHGRGAEVDSALFEESVRPGPGDRGVPAVRYAHGILRQALFELLSGSDLFVPMRRCKRSGLVAGEADCDTLEEPCPVCRIFGTPARPSLWSFSTLRTKRYSGAVPEARSRILRRAGMDLVRRRAEDRKLFAEEVGPHLLFGFEAEAQHDSVESRVELSLLFAAAASVRGIGRSRHRGRGECSIALVANGISTADLWSCFEAVWLRGEPAEQGAGSTGFVDAVDARAAAPRASHARAGWIDDDASDPWTELRLLARLDEPVIAGSHVLTGNLLQSEDSVAGRILLGALAGEALRRGAHSTDPRFLHAFRGGGALFPDLVPVFRESDHRFQPVLPAPRDLLTCPIRPGSRRQGGHGVRSALLSDPAGPTWVRTCPICDVEGRPNVKLRPLHGYSIPGLGAPEFEPPLREETKTEVDPYTGRVGPQSLYHRMMIPAGTLMAGTLRIRPLALEWLRGLGLLAPNGAMEIRLGKRSGRGYGTVRLTNEQVPDTETEADEARLLAYLARGWVPVVLRTGLTGRDGFGRSPQRLEAADLGFPAPKPDAPVRCAVAWGEVGGYWTHIGMPRQREYTLLPGSVLHLRREDYEASEWAAVESRLRELQRDARVGDRLAEGCGCLEVAPFPYDDLENEPRGPLDLPASPRWIARQIPDALAIRAGTLVAPAERFDALREDYFEALADSNLGGARRAEWRSVARLLHSSAGRSRREILWMLHGYSRTVNETEEGSDGGAATRDPSGPRGGLSEARNTARRKPCPVLAENRAGARMVLRQIWHATAVADQRATRTRALADALAELSGTTTGES